LKAWVGKSETVTDYLTQSLIDRFRATLGPSLWSGGGVPLGLHWCLALPAAPTADLSEDGHAKKGDFLPPVPLPSRMWAGGEVIHHHGLTPNAPVTRVSTITDIVAKQGKSGDLVFVTIGSKFYSGDQLCITEEQNLVFRGLSSLGKSAMPEYTPPVADTLQDTMTPDPVLLFRYSALTFNAHRIHYDRDYAQNSEGYPDLIVHGPLQATLLLNQVARSLGAVPRRITYLGLAPLFCGTPIGLHVTGENGTGESWCSNADGIRTMSARFEV
jgi:3-methylfumaryl-CoA hydratase